MRAGGRGAPLGRERGGRGAPLGRERGRRGRLIAVRRGCLTGARRRTGRSADAPPGEDGGSGEWIRDGSGLQKSTGRRHPTHARVTRPRGFPLPPTRSRSSPLPDSFTAPSVLSWRRICRAAGAAPCAGEAASADGKRAPSPTSCTPRRGALRPPLSLVRGEPRALLHASEGSPGRRRAPSSLVGYFSSPLPPSSASGSRFSLPKDIMESTSDVQMQHCAEYSETTIEIKIKTLDSQTYNLRVNKCVPVPLLKEKIATVTGILSEQQRLICRGRVLKDDELLSAYHVEDGHTLHLVVRQPGQSAISGNAGTEANTSNSGRRRGPTVARSVVLEAVNVDPGSSELPAFIAQILQGVLGSISAQSSGAPVSSDTRPSEPTQSSIPNTVRVELDQQQLFQSEPAHGPSQPNVIPDALTTMSQYIDFMRDSFRSEGFNHNGQTEVNVENRTAGSTSVGVTQNQESHPESASTLGLHTASLLAETMHSTRQIVVEQAGALLSQLSAQLGDLQNVTDPAMRRDLQSSAFRFGSLLQNLGSLLLELGRTTMLLRINPASSEAVVNSGPALYISPSGPNPLMVQPVPFFPGRSVQMGTLFSSLGRQGSVLHPRDVDIHVRTSGSAPVASTNPSEPAGAQAQQHVNRTGDASHANIGEASAGGTPFSVESGVRLLPLRTVVAMPAGISRAPSGSSSGGLGIIYPLITRVRQRASTNGSDERNGQSPNEPARSSTHPNEQSIPQSSQAHEAGILGSPTDVGVGNGSETSPGQQNGLVTLSQIMDFLGSMLPGENVRGNSSSQQAPMASTEQGDGRNRATPQVSGASEEALRFASMVRQIMPFISQVETQNQSTPPDSNSTPAQAASGSANRARDGPSESTSSHQHNRDQIDEPNSKRQRTNE